MFFPICSDQHKQPVSLLSLHSELLRGNYLCPLSHADCHSAVPLAWLRWTCGELLRKLLQISWKMTIKSAFMNKSNGFSTLRWDSTQPIYQKKYTHCLSGLVSGNGMQYFFPLSAWIFLYRQCVCLQSEESGLFNMCLENATLLCDSNWITGHNTRGCKEVKSRDIILKGEGQCNF